MLLNFLFLAKTIGYFSMSDQSFFKSKVFTIGLLDTLMVRLDLAKLNYFLTLNSQGGSISFSVCER